MPAGDALDVFLKIGAFAVPLVGGLIAWAISRHIKLNHLQAEHEKVIREKNELAGSLEETRQRNHEARQELVKHNERLSRKYQDAYTKFHQLRRHALALRAQLQEAQRPVELEENASSENSAAELEAQLAAVQQELEECRARIDDAAKTDGRIWLRPVTGSIPAFRPRDQRQCAIISVLNLKGGVGKTTITANLAATMATKDSRCLLLDLDFQRSLSMLMVGIKDRKLLHFSQKSVQHFLAGDDHSSSSLLNRKHDLDADVPHCSILTNSDSRAGSSGADGLEETESRLMVEWLFDRNKPDPRFFLREALHERAIGDSFRYMFMDCPPRLTTACVNALAASDFVIIPVVPDPVSTRAAENLLTSLQSLRSVICPDLRVLAVVPNMVRLGPAGPLKAHASSIDKLRLPLQALWPHEPIHICETKIYYDAQFGIAAAVLDSDDKVKLAKSDKDVKAGFQKLADELIQEMRHHDSRNAAAIPA